MPSSCRCEWSGREWSSIGRFELRFVSSYHSRFEVSISKKWAASTSRVSNGKRRGRQRDYTAIETKIQR